MSFPSWCERYLDISHRQANGEYTCLCPYHDDTTASMRVNVHKQVFFCMSCGAKGSGQQLMADVGSGEQVHAEVDEVRRKLAALTRQQERLRPHSESWLDQFDMPTDYWTKVRGFSEKVIAQYRLGYDPLLQAVTIPIRGPGGAPVGVIRRMLDPDIKPRYRYPLEFARNEQLWGLWELQSQRELNGPLAIVEGALDAVAMREAHVPAVAILGSHMAPHQAKLLRDAGIKEVVVCTDNDKAGDDATEHIVRQLTGLRIRVRQYQPGWGKDPCELSIPCRTQLYVTSKPVVGPWQLKSRRV